jgi:hypothetical protein
VNSSHSCSVLYNFIGLLEEDEITYSWFQQDGATVHTTQLNFWMRFSDNVLCLETYGPLTRWILLHQSSVCVEQQNLQCIVIAHAHLTFRRGVTGSARIAKTQCTAHHIQALILSLISPQQMESNCNWAALCMSAKVLSLLWCERWFLQIIYK